MPGIPAIIDDGIAVGAFIFGQAIEIIAILLQKQDDGNSTSDTCHPRGVAVYSHGIEE
jgi:hypothetical protein